MNDSTWTIDHSHSAIHFTVRHMMFSKVRGRFTEWSGDLSLDHEDLTRSRVSAVIQVAGVDTGVDDRDAHLRSPDFFDAQTFPEIRFQSTRIERVAPDHYRVTGNLTIRDVTREVTLEAEDGGRGQDPWGNQRAGFTLHGRINRKDFGLGWNQLLETGGVLIGEDVEIGIEIQAVRSSGQQVA